MIPSHQLSVVILLALLLPELSCRMAVVAGEGEKIVFLQQWGKRGREPGEFRFPIGIAISAADEVLITDHMNHRIQKFDTQGKLLAQFSVLPNPGGIALDKAGNIYLTHFQASSASNETAGNRVSVYSPEGKLLRQWGKTGSGEGEFDCPGGIAVAKDGSVYVADQTNHRVQVFDASGKFLFQWGKYGNAPGEFGGQSSKGSRIGGPQFIAFDAAGNIWTTEGANCRVQKFTAKGKYLLSWGSNEDKPGSFGGTFTGFPDRKAGGIRGPVALVFDKNDQLWISTVSGRIQLFTQKGEYVRGLVAEQGTGPGQFYAPHGVALDRAGRLYVVDAYNHRIQKFDVAPKQK